MNLPDNECIERLRAELDDAQTAEERRHIIAALEAEQDRLSDIDDRWIPSRE